MAERKRAPRRSSQTLLVSGDSAPSAIAAEAAVAIAAALAPEAYSQVRERVARVFDNKVSCFTEVQLPDREANARRVDVIVVNGTDDVLYLYSCHLLCRGSIALRSRPSMTFGGRENPESGGVTLEFDPAIRVPAHEPTRLELCATLEERVEILSLELRGERVPRRGRKATEWKQKTRGGVPRSDGG